MTAASPSDAIARRMVPLIIGLLGLTCSQPRVSPSVQEVTVLAHPTFYHVGFGAGPVLFTGSSGQVVEERRIEPFGVPIGSHTAQERDLNPLNKRTDPSTGWSDHGARWMSAATGRWLSTDPPVTAPSPSFMFMPWTLHPYQYVNQNPVAYWDPAGTCSAPVLAPGQVGICIEAYISAPSVGPFGMGHGDGRAPDGNDSNKTNRIQQQFTIDRSAWESGSAAGIAEAARISDSRVKSWVAWLPFVSASEPASGGTSYDGVVAGEGSIAFTARGRGINGYSKYPGGPSGSIDYGFRFKVEGGDVDLVNGAHKGFPSHSVYSYQRAASGGVITTTLYESKERLIDDLNYDFNGLKDSVPGPGIFVYSEPRPPQTSPARSRDRSTTRREW